MVSGVGVGKEEEVSMEVAVRWELLTRKKIVGKAKDKKPTENLKKKKFGWRSLWESLTRENCWKGERPKYERKPKEEEEDEEYY